VGQIDPDSLSAMAAMQADFSPSQPMNESGIPATVPNSPGDGCDGREAIEALFRFCMNNGGRTRGRPHDGPNHLAGERRH